MEGNSRKVHRRFLKLHGPSIPCILDSLGKDKILCLIKIDEKNFKIVVMNFWKGEEKILEKEKSSNSNQIHIFYLSRLMCQTCYAFRIQYV